MRKKEERAHLARIVEAAEGQGPLPPEVRDEAAAFREDVAWLRPPPSPEPGPWMARRVRAALEARRQRRFVFGFGAAVFGPGLAVAAVLLLFWRGGAVQSPPSLPRAEAPADMSALAADALPALDALPWEQSPWTDPEALDSVEEALLDELAQPVSDEVVDTLSREMAFGLDLQTMIEEMDSDSLTRLLTSSPG
ncbi:MAG: hypothetical protein D6729_15025 [Deltaproteobacteria bacterium]|nr:MAG: hypothetical protein D6729_15025 [Deltaproteobacteria bacterium]